EVLHREVDAAELPTRCVRDIPRVEGAAGQQYGVVLGAQALAGDVDADVAPGHKCDALRLQLFHAPVDVVLLQLEVGDAVPQQAADAVLALVQRDGVAGAGELLRGGESGGTGADDRDPAPGRLGWRQRWDRAAVSDPVNDLHFDLLDGHRIVRDAQHAGRLAGGRTQPAGELRKVV